MCVLAAAGQSRIFLVMSEEAFVGFSTCKKSFSLCFTVFSANGYARNYADKEPQAAHTGGSQQVFTSQIPDASSEMHKS